MIVGRSGILGDYHIAEIRGFGIDLGTDVITTAVRELILVARASGQDPHEALKIGAIILAAPDISGDVTSQRNNSENLFDGFESVTYYVMKKDRAIGSAEWLFADKKRIGQIRPQSISETQYLRFKAMPEVIVVDSRIRTDFLGHGYFLSSPATFSDLILDLRYDRPIGEGRPLTKIAPNFYILDDDFPQIELVQVPTEVDGLRLLSTGAVWIAERFTDRSVVFLAVNVASFGIVWVVKFFVLEHFLFGHRVDEVAEPAEV